MHAHVRTTQGAEAKRGTNERTNEQVQCRQATDNEAYNDQITTKYTHHQQLISQSDRIKSKLGYKPNDRS